MHKIKRELTKFLTICSVCFILFSCTKSDIRLQDNVINGQYTQVIEVDTISPTLNTILLDSFSTSGTATALAGYYNDPYFGKIKASSYFQLQPPPYSSGTSSAEYNNAIFDSLTLYVNLTSNYYGDTTKQIKFNIYRLAENIYPRVGSGPLYNNDSFSIDKNQGLLNYRNDAFMIRPNTPGNYWDTLSLRLSDAWGQKLLTMLQNQDVNIQNPTSFNDFFKGLKIETPNTGSTIASFKDSIQMRLYYSVPGVPVYQQKIATFTLYNSLYQFNRIAVDRTGTPLQNISQTNNMLPSASTNNMAFAQSVTGIMTKISFPTINNVLQNPNFLQITNATLFIKPVLGTYDLASLLLPRSLRLVQANVQNMIGNMIGSGSAVAVLGSVGYDLPISGTSSSQTGSLTMATNVENSYYTYDLTGYLQTVLRNNLSAYSNGYGLILTTPASTFNSTFNRVVIGDVNSPNPINRIQLKVFYLAVQ